MGITLLLYRPIVTALRKTKLIESGSSPKNHKLGITLVGLLLLISCIMAILVWKGIL